MKLKRPAFLYIVFLISSHLSGQPVISRFENISVNEGLSQSSVYSILQDREGFMWFGTSDGLNRYDGQEIKVFKVKSPDNAANSNFFRGTLLQDSHDNIWFSNETGIYYFDPLREAIQTAFTFERMTSSPIYSTIRLEGTDLWMGTIQQGIMCYSIERRKISYYQYPFSNRNVFDWSVLGKKILFSAKGEPGFFSFDIQNKSFERRWDDRKDVKVRVSRGRLFISSHDQLVTIDSLDRVIEVFKTDKPLDHLHSLVEDRFGRIWISILGSGLYCYLPKEHKGIIHRHDNPKPRTLASDLTTRLYIDRADNLWIGTDEAGISKLDLKPPKFNLFPLNEDDYPGLKDYFTKCFLEDRKERIWFGTHLGGLVILDPQTGRTESFLHESGKPNSLPGNTVGAIFEDRYGNTWVGHNKGISLFDYTTRQFRPLEFTMPFPLDTMINFVYKIIERRNGDLVAATYAGLIGFSPLPDDHGKYKGKRVGPQWGSMIADVIETRDGTLWFASPFKGVFHVTKPEDPATPSEHYFASMDLRSICQDSREDSILWIGSGKGLIRFNVSSRTSRTFDERDGLGNTYIYGVLEDSLHNFWLSSNRGLSYLSVQPLAVQNFSVNDGLQSNEFNTGAFYKGRSGKFYFGGIKGFNWFHSAKFTQSTTGPGVAITSITVNEMPWAKDSIFAAANRIDLSYDLNNLSFQFAALDFTHPQANRIQYQLQGWDNDWASAKAVRYSRLSPGSYTLHVRASTDGGVWNEAPPLTIVIHSPFWEQLWFYLFTTFVAVSILVFSILQIIRINVRRRVRELEKERAIDAERLRISKDMHDEIGSGLTHIALLSELISAEDKTTSEMKGEVGVISSTAQKLVQSIGEIIWITHPQNDTVENLVAYLREQTRQYFEPFDVKYIIDMPDSLPLIYLSNVQRRNLFLVVKEALNNALKHAKASRVVLSLTIAEETLAFRVEDDGQGFGGNSVRKHSNGLRNMKSRIEEINGQFDIQTAPGQGMVISFVVPFLS